MDEAPRNLSESVIEITVVGIAVIDIVGHHIACADIGMPMLGVIEIPSTRRPMYT